MHEQGCDTMRSTSDGAAAASAEGLGPGRRLAARARRGVREACTIGVRAGLPPSWVGYRHVVPVSAQDHVASMRAKGVAFARCETIHARAVARNPLPFNVADRDLLPADAGWWGYSMRDVPARTSEETFIATIPDARIVPVHDWRGEFFPALLTRDQRALNLREMKFRDAHAAALRRGAPPQRFERATWICERVYDNHSHWLTAHLPKLVLLRDRGALGEVLLPRSPTPAMRASLRMMGLDPDAFRTVDGDRPIEVARLTILGTDRFRPELLRPVREALAPVAAAPTRRVYVSRERARMRKLANEDEIWPLFEAAGFQRVFMEELDFPRQVRLMSETTVLAAPHGAGLTNMMFCPPGARVLEIAWLGFPNPNFYALASAMGHRWGIVAAQPRGPGSPLERDMYVDPAAVETALDALARTAAAPAGPDPV